jgi:hypothetical protein
VVYLRDHRITFLASSTQNVYVAYSSSFFGKRYTGTST